MLPELVIIYQSSNVYFNTQEWHFRKLRAVNNQLSEFNKTQNTSVTKLFDMLLDITLKPTCLH